MLKMMRDSFRHLKWILIMLVAIFMLFVFVDWGAGGAAGGEAPRAYAARVNGQTVSYRDYDRALYYAEQNYKRMYGGQFTPEMAQSMGLNRQVLDSLIDQRLLLQEADRVNLRATPEEIRQRILEIPTLNPEGKFVGQELYNRFTAQLGYQSPAEFEEDLAREITLSKIESALANSLVVSPQAADAEYRRSAENAKVRYVLYSAGREAATVTVTPAEAEAYYRSNQANYAHGEQRQLKYLIADFGRLRSQIVLTDADLRRRYEATREEFKRPEAARILHILIKVDPGAAADVDAAARAKAESLVKQLRGGADFAALAKQNSGDPSSSGNGGDMGFIERGQTVEAFDTAAFTIPLNQISDPIRTPEYGYHIIKVLERRPGGYRSFEEVKSELSSRVVDQTSRDQAREAINSIAARIRQKKPATVDEFAALANDKVSLNDSQWFQKAEAIPGLGFNAPLSTWSFSAKQGDTGEVSNTQRGLVLPYLAAIRPAGITALDEVRVKVESDARMARARELARQKLATALSGAASIDAVGTKVGMTPAETTVSRQGFVSGIPGDTAALVDAAMNAKVGETKGPIVVGDAAVAFQVLELKKVDDKELQTNRAGYMDALRAQQARGLRSVLLQRLRKGAKIEINDQVLQTGTATA